MPNSNLAQTISATGNTHAISLTLGGAQQGPKPDTTCNIVIKGTYTGATLQVEGQSQDGTWCPLGCIDRGTMVFNPGGTAFSITNSGTKNLTVDCAGFVAVRVWAAALSTGSLTVNMYSDFFYNYPLTISTTTQSTVSGATTITAASANALTVGPNGTTNPSFNIDSSATSAATGWQMTAAAAGSGADFKVLSSGTNESGTIEAKGTGTLTLNGTTACTGAVNVGGAASGNNATGMSFTPAAAASGFAMQVLSTGAAEALTIDAKGAAAVTIGGAAAGATGLTIGSSTSKATAVLNVVSSSAAAVTVGPNGATNPCFKVNANTSSAATGFLITGLAAGNGVTLAAISSGSNENCKIDAKAAGSIAIGSVSTGQVSIGRGSVAPPILSNTISSIGTSQSSTPTAAQVCGGVVTQTGATGAGTVTLPTGTQIETQLTANSAYALANGDSIMTTFANLGGGQTLTITTSTGLTLAGTVAVGSAKNATMEFVRTAANTFTVYCMVSA